MAGRATPSDPPKIDGLEYVELLGSGGYSDVHLYQQLMPRRPVAVKVLRDVGMTEALRRQFTAEANAMAELADHPSIVPVFSAAVAADGRPYIVMMYYPNDNLAARAARERFAVSEVLRIGIQITSAVETAHRAGILHRDIKPANILTSQYGAVGLADFGIAGQATTADDDDDTGVSVPWSPPEVLYATAPASVQSDVYSLGATLWNLLVGRSPFEVVGADNSAYALMRRIRETPVPTTGRADVPPSLERLLAQTLAKDPSARPSTALDLARSLQAVELEQHLARTEIVLVEERPAPSRDVPTEDSGATRLRAPVRIDPDGGVAGAAAPEPAPPARTPVFPPNDGESPTVRRPTVVAGPVDAPKLGNAERAPEPEGATVRREPATSTSAGSEPENKNPAVPSPPRRPVGILVGAVAVVVVIAAIVGVRIVGGEGGSAATSTTTIEVSSNPDEVGPPGRVTVSAQQLDAAQATFTWTYNDSLPTDSFFWQLDDGTQSGEVSAPTVTLANPAGTRQCLQVKVRRADGSQASPTWSEPGCVG